jgi:hypothetical protein
MFHHIYVGRNVAHDGRQASFWSKTARDVIFSQNEAYGNHRHGSQPGGGMGYQYGPDYLWFIFNEIHGNNYGIRQSDTSSDDSPRSFFIGNLIYDIHPDDASSYDASNGWRPGVAISLWHGNQNRTIVNNTIYDVHGGYNSIYGGIADVSNNIISSIHDADAFVSSSHSARDGNESVDHLLLYDPENAFRIHWNWSNYDSLAEFQASIGQCSSCTVADPRFVDAANLDFRLAAASPALDAGVEHPAYQTFQDRYGIDIRVDFNGVARPRGSGWDLGAFED